MKRCGDAALWGSQSWLQPAFSRLSSPAQPPVSAARDAPERTVRRSCERLLLFAALLLAGCGRYADFTLPPIPGGDPNLTFAFDERPEPVLGRSSGFDSQDAMAPSVITWWGPGLLNFYSGYDGATWRTGEAFSMDGIRWKSGGAAFLAPDPHTWEGSYIAGNGSVVVGFDDSGPGARRDAFWYYYVAGPRNAGRIGLARSRIGHALRKEPTPVLQNGPFESWDERAVADPYVVHIHPYFYLYYLGQDRADPPRQRLGVARSTDGFHWEKLRANPILEPGPPGSFDEAGDGEPAVWQSNGYYWMLFTGRDFSEIRRLGLARSTDGVHWTKLPAVFSGTQAWDSKVICDPTVVVKDGEIRVWFGGGDVASPDENLHGQIGFAVLRPVNATLAK
jgi:predicted GH43/DUF377 family glycosyl hydrolase